MPTRVSPRRSIVGVAAASSPRAVVRITCVSAVARGRVCERVARVKSSKRSRSTTVRPVRPARRIRPVTRSTSATRVASTSACDLGAAPECALRSDRAAAAARLQRAAGRGCGRGRGAVARRRGPSIVTSAVSASPATWPTVMMPRDRSFAAVTGPTPQSRSTGSGWRKPSSSSGGTTSRPSGLATPLATLARNFVRATPDRDR